MEISQIALIITLLNIVAIVLFISRPDFAEHTIGIHYLLLEEGVWSRIFMVLLIWCLIFVTIPNSLVKIFFND